MCCYVHPMPLQFTPPFGGVKPGARQAPPSAAPAQASAPPAVIVAPPVPEPEAALEGTISSDSITGSWSDHRTQRTDGCLPLLPMLSAPGLPAALVPAGAAGGAVQSVPIDALFNRLSLISEGTVLAVGEPMPATFDGKARAAYAVITTNPLPFFTLVKTEPIKEVYRWATAGLLEPEYVSSVRAGGWSVTHEIYMTTWLIIAGVMDCASLAPPALPLVFISLVLGYTTNLDIDDLPLDFRGRQSSADSVVAKSFITVLSRQCNGWREHAYTAPGTSAATVAVGAAVSFAMKLRGDETAKMLQLFLDNTTALSYKAAGMKDVIARMQQLANEARAAGITFT